MKELILKNQLVIMESMVKNRWNEEREKLKEQIKITNEKLSALANER